MNTIQRQDLIRLGEHDRAPCISLFMPLREGRPDGRQDAIRLKNLIQDARRQGERLELPDAEVEQALQPALALLDDAEFGPGQGRGLAFVLAPGLEFQHRAPVPFPEVAVVSNRPHLKPLLSVLDRDERFHVLSISQDEVQAYACSRFGCNEIDVPNMPTSLQEALWMDDPEKSLQYHTLGGQPGPARSPAVYHGHGAGDDDENTDLLRFFTRVDRAFCDVANGHRWPLVLACVEHYLPIYRSVSRHPDIVDQVVAGSPKQRTPDELHEQAWQIVAPRFRTVEHEALENLGAAAAAGRASRAVREIVPAAVSGRIEHLFIADDERCWGRPGENGLAPDVHEKREPGDLDLLDFAALQTLHTGGEVFTRSRDEMPDGAVAAATFRY